MKEQLVPSLNKLGWNSFFQQAFEQAHAVGTIPARIVRGNYRGFHVCSQHGDLEVKLSGKLLRGGREGIHRPAVGDRVLVEPDFSQQKGVIQAILPRISKFSRKVAGQRAEEQVIATNIDTVFIVSSLEGGRSLSLRRIERYLTLAWNSGAVPVIVLNKTDLCPDISSAVEEVEAVSPGVSIYAVSGKDNTGLESLKKYILEGCTVAFLGSSGAGKSTLINALLGYNRQMTGAVKTSDHTGRHTTTRRELILLPEGGIVIDTPGMRELQMWGDDSGLESCFQDIEVLSRQCRFRDCNHDTEKGCAVTEALRTGELDLARFESYRKLQGEINHVSSMNMYGARQHEKMKWKKISKLSKEINRED